MQVTGRARWIPVTELERGFAETAIVYRLLDHSNVITIRGDSYRLRAKRLSGMGLAIANTEIQTD